MMRFVRAALAAGFVFAGAAAAQPAPVEAFGRLPAIGGVQISPDGQLIILDRGEGSSGAVAIYRIEGDAFRQVRQMNAPAGGSIRGVDFADDRYALVTISQTFNPTEAARESTGSHRLRRGNSSSVERGATDRADSRDSTEFWRQLTVDVASGESAFVLNNARFQLYRAGLGNLSAPIDGDPGYGRMMSYDYAAAVPTAVIYRVGLGDGRGSIVHRGGPHTGAFCMDARGVPYARMDYDDDDFHWAIYAIEGERARLVSEGEVAENEEWRIPSLACVIQGRPGVVAISGYRDGEDRATISALDLRTGESTPLFEQEAYDVGTLRDPYTREVIGYGWTSPRGGEYRFIDPQIEAVNQQLSQRFGAGYYSVSGWDRARARFVVTGETAQQGPAVFLFEPQADRLRLIGAQYPELAGTELPQRQAITFRARDGTRIPAFLTLPPGVDPTNLPLVVMPHGGPHAQNVTGFDWWSAFMASRGYAVLEPDFRGSTGYGRAWEEAGHGQWGNGVMQHDVSDGVLALIRNGMVDAARVCIVGASYGGYAALAGATFTPDLYACAISVAGVSDVRRMLLREIQVTGADSGVARFWKESMGEENLDRDSPAQHIENVRAPILLIHGAHDTVVPFDQSTWMRDRLRARGRDVRLVELQGDDHWLSDAATRTQMLREIESFLAEHIGADRG